MSDVSPPDPRREPALARRWILWTLFIVPTTYFLSILGTLIHEAAGHGLAALLCGGRFGGFWFDSWGRGASGADAPGFEMQVLVAGTAVEAAAALLALLGARRMPRGHWGRVAALLAAWEFMGSACFGVFLGGFPEMGTSDFARAAEFLPGPQWGRLFAVAGGLAFVTSAAALGTLLTSEAEAAFGTVVGARGGRRAAVVMLFVLLPGLRWLLPWIAFSVDPHGEIYRVPSVWPLWAAILVHAAVALVLTLVPGRAPPGSEASVPGRMPIGAAWALAAVLLSIGIRCSQGM